MANQPEFKVSFGQSANIDKALSEGLIDKYDLLLLDGEVEPKIGWVDKNGNSRIVDTAKEILSVSILPALGQKGKIYLYENVAYVWDTETEDFVSISQPADLTALEQELAKKVDEQVVDEKIADALGSITGIEIVEF